MAYTNRYRVYWCHRRFGGTRANRHLPLV